MGTVLVTGASSGIGEACALHLDRLGHRVYAGVRKQEDARGLGERGSDRMVPVFLDVTDQGQVDAVASQIAGDAGKLDGVVNNAGIGRGGPLEYLPLAEWREQLEVNVVGQVAVTKAVLPLIRSAGGRIVFIGSIGGRVATMMVGPYCASKFAVRQAARSDHPQDRRPVTIPHHRASPHGHPEPGPAGCRPGESGQGGGARAVLAAPEDPLPCGHRREGPERAGPVAARQASRSDHPPDRRPVTIPAVSGRPHGHLHQR